MSVIAYYEEDYLQYAAFRSRFTNRRVSVSMSSIMRQRQCVAVFFCTGVSDGLALSGARTLGNQSLRLIVLTYNLFEFGHFKMVRRALHAMDELQIAIDPDELSTVLILLASGPDTTDQCRFDALFESTK